MSRLIRFFGLALAGLLSFTSVANAATMIVQGPASFPAAGGGGSAVYEQVSYRFFNAGAALPSLGAVATDVVSGDFATSGSNTATTAPAVAYPAYGSGDLVIACIGVDNSAGITITPPANGPNSETRTILGNSVATDQGIACMYWVGTGTQSASTQNWTISGAGEQWVGRTFKVPAGEFNSADPIDSTSSVTANASDATPPTPAWSGTDANARVIVAIATDAVNVTAAPTNWTLPSGQDIGATALYVMQRNALTSAAESIASADATLASADTTSVLGFAINANPNGPLGRTPLAAADTGVTLTADTDYGVSVRVKNATATGTDSFKWQYKHTEGTNTWTDISSSSDVIIADTTADFANGDDVGEYITGTGTYASDNNAGLDTTGAFTLAAPISATGSFESHLNFQVVDADTADADTIELRIVTGAGAALDIYTATPEITVGGPDVAFDTFTASAITTSGTTATTGNFTVASNTNRALVCFVSNRSTLTGTAVAYTAGSGGTFAMLDEVTSGVYRTEVWYSVAPSTGTVAVQATYSGTITSDANIVCHSLYNVDQSTPLDGYAEGAAASISITKSTGGMAIALMMSSGDPGAITAGTLTYDDVNNEYFKGGYNTSSGTISFTSGSGFRVMAGANVRKQ